MSIDRDRNVYGQSLGVDMGPEKGVAVIHHEKAEYLKTIGFDFGGDPEELKRDGASSSPTSSRASRPVDISSIVAQMHV